MAGIERWKPGQWRARYRTPDGKSRGKVFPRKVDGEQFLTSVEHRKLTGGYVDPSAGKVTVGEYWSRWEERQQWRDSSRRLVASYFANHVEPTLGSYPLNSLRRGDIESFGAKLPVAPRTARQIVQCVSTSATGVVGLAGQVLLPLVFA